LFGTVDGAAFGSISFVTGFISGSGGGASSAVEEINGTRDPSSFVRARDIRVHLLRSLLSRFMCHYIGSTFGRGTNNGYERRNNNDAKHPG